MSTQPHTSPPEGGDANTRLTLTDDSGLVGPKRFGELVAKKQGRDQPYTSQSVANWCTRGQATPKKIDDRGWRLFDPAHAATVAENVPQPSRGGARTGSGRRRTSPQKSDHQKNGPQKGGHQKDGPPGAAETGALDGLIGSAVAARDAIDGFHQRDENNEQISRDEAVHITEFLGIKRAEMEAVMQHFGTGPRSISPAAVDLVNKLVDAKYKDQKLALLNGELVKRDDLVAAVQATHGPVVEMLGALPQTLAAAVAPHAWVGEGLVGEAVAMVHHLLADGLGIDTKQPAVVETLDALRAKLARPAAQEATIRAVIAARVDAARTRLVESTNTGTETLS